jgi:hypothetical protein
MNSRIIFSIFLVLPCVTFAKAPIYLGTSYSQQIANQLVQKRKIGKLGWATDIPTKYIEKHIDYFLNSMGREAACAVDDESRPVKLSCKMIDESNIVEYELRATAILRFENGKVVGLILDDSTASLIMKEQN